MTNGTQTHDNQDQPNDNGNARPEAPTLWSKIKQSTLRATGVLALMGAVSLGGYLYNSREKPVDPKPQATSNTHSIERGNLKNYTFKEGEIQRFSATEFGNNTLGRLVDEKYKHDLDLRGEHFFTAEPLNPKTEFISVYDNGTQKNYTILKNVVPLQSTWEGDTRTTRTPEEINVEPNQEPFYFVNVFSDKENKRVALNNSNKLKRMTYIAAYPHTLEGISTEISKDGTTHIKTETFDELTGNIFGFDNPIELNGRKYVKAFLTDEENFDNLWIDVSNPEELSPRIVTETYEGGRTRNRLEISGHMYKLVRGTPINKN